MRRGMNLKKNAPAALIRVNVIFCVLTLRRDNIVRDVIKKEYMSGKNGLLNTAITRE